MVEQVCKAILAEVNSKPVRITIALIGKRIGKLSWLEKYQHKLPVTMSILSTYVESVSQFQMRRVRWAAERLSWEWPIKRWKLEKLAGLRPDYSQEVSDEIDRCIGQSRLLQSIHILRGDIFMATLTLRSWPFPEDQEAELVWFGSPFMDYKGNWRIRSHFER